MLADLPAIQPGFNLLTPAHYASHFCYVLAIFAGGFLDDVQQVNRAIGSATHRAAHGIGIPAPVAHIGGTAALRASVAVKNGDAVPITWTTSNPAAATVDPFGLVTAVGDGEALITATTPDGHSACCNVYCGTQVAIQEQIEADEAKIALGVLGGFAVLVGALALAVSGS